MVNQIKRIMKELSIEEKAHRYDEALDRAKKLYEQGTITECLGHVFPELKESEDEKIRKGLITFFSRFPYNNMEDAGINAKDVISWLEKQEGCEYIKKDWLEHIKQSWYKEGFIDGKYTPKELTINDVATLNELIDFLENGTAKLQHDLTIYANWLKTQFPTNEKQGEQKSADNVGPKFHEGEWVIDKQGIVHQISNVIENVTNHTYGYDIVGGGYFNDNTEGVRLWTIQDAKAGDVLVCESGWTCIFKALDNHTNTFSSYCFMDSGKWFCNTGSECHTLNKAFIKAYNGEIHPTTKEQRDILFAKMKEAGYEWDAEKKELKKIEQIPIDVRTTGYWHVEDVEQKSVWSEEDENRINRLIAYFEDKESFTAEDDVVYANWLKSLKDKYTWKPSDEQMKALKEACDKSWEPDGLDPLYTLYEQLKKLKGKEV